MQPLITRGCAQTVYFCARSNRAGLFFMIQRCNIHQRDVLHAVVAAQAVDQSVGGIHSGDAGDAELHGLAAQADGIALGVAALGAGGEDM